MDNSGMAVVGVMLLVYVLIILAIVAVVFWTQVKILRRMGFSGWWVLLNFVPLGVLVGLILLATQPWPNVPGSSPPSAA